MAFLAFLKFGLQEFAVGKPLGIHHPAIYVIMQYLHLAVILGLQISFYYSREFFAYFL